MNNASEPMTAAGAIAPPALLTREDVANVVGVPLRTLTWWIWALDEEKRYRFFELSRRNGSAPRPIHAPIRPIKDLQRKLADILLASYRPRVHVHGFVLDRSPVTNARVHQGQQWVLRVDLNEFFPSINFGRVRGMFMSHPFNYPPDVATLLGQICCHKNQLPQGAPTSPIVSNYICRSLDSALSRLARLERCRYTRYADDLCFSTDRNVFPQVLGSIEAGEAVIGALLTEAIETNGFTVNPSKTRLMRRTQRQRVTGLVVNRKVNVTRQYVRSLRSLLYIWGRYGEEHAAKALEQTNPHPNWPPDKPRPAFKQVVRGRVQHVGSIKGWSSPVYVRLASMLSEVDEDYHASHPLPVSDPSKPDRVPTSVRLFTEGVTDPLHIAAAHRHFSAKGEFTEFEFVVSDDSHLGGDDALLKFGKHLARMPQLDPCILLFDRDKPGIVTAATNGHEWKNLGNNVGAVVIAPPPWRSDGEPLCVEMLHGEDVLTRIDTAGRRVFLLEEFDRDTALHTTRKYNIPNAKNATLVQENVFEVTTGKSVGLGKRDFADAIYEMRAPYAQIDFEGFRRTFELIREVLRSIVDGSPTTPASN
jgi:RNA-directed DNA polymerase